MKQASPTSAGSLVSSLPEEEQKTRHFPYVIYRPGPTGRRAALVGGPDVWEVIRDLRHWPDLGTNPIEHLANDLSLPAELVSVAADFYATFPDEIDARLEANEQAVQQICHRNEQIESLPYSSDIKIQDSATSNYGDHDGHL